MFQQLMSRLLYTQLYLKSPFFIFFVGFSGLITGINPCTISILPISLAYFNWHKNQKISLKSLLLGIWITFIIILLVFSILGYRYYIVLIGLPFLSAFFAILLGFLILDIFSLKTNINIKLDKFFVLFQLNAQNFLLGSFLTVNTLPCVIPILLTLFTILSSANNYLLISFYISIYLFGYMLPLLVLVLVVLRLRYFQLYLVSFIFRFYKLISGCFMLSWGILKCLEIVFP